MGGVSLSWLGPPCQETEMGQRFERGEGIILEVFGFLGSISRVSQCKDQEVSQSLVHCGPRPGRRKMGKEDRREEGRGRRKRVGRKSRRRRGKKRAGSCPLAPALTLNFKEKYVYFRLQHLENWYFFWTFVLCCTLIFFPPKS